MKAQQIREIYRDFFVRHDHQAWPSDALIPKSDPTLLFTSAGMVQFKDYFLGKMGDTLKRATTCQKCFRTSDIDSVGYTARHHTFFEMLGNFSFGDYFKQEAIVWAWELVTEDFKIPKERLWVSVFTDDDEAAEIWQREAGVPSDRILRFGEDENFWSMGDTGPCGPCSELYYDMGGDPDEDPTESIEAGLDRFLEIWNLVFTQFDKQADGSLLPLPRKNVDTGMGLERTAAVLQGVGSNFETDLFMPIIRHMESISGRKYNQNPETDTALRVIGDHARAALFTMTDHITPSNEGRGYVLRRIMRRAIRFARKIDVEQSFFPELMETVADLMGKEYPEVKESLPFAQKIAASEEDSFRSTLERGIHLLSEMVAKAKEQERDSISGSDVFRLYDTYGFPHEITREILEEEGMKFSEEEFESEMHRQRRQSQQAWKGSGEQEKLHFEGLESLEATEFVGYDGMTAKGKVIASRKNEDQSVLILDRTPFYGESGGQVGDKGRIVSEDGSGVFLVEDCQRTPAGVCLHVGRFEKGTFEEGEQVIAEVESSLRRETMKNHTATHLLHAALREVLGGHVKQSGSKVSPNSLRFDYTHFEAPSAKQLRQVEDIVNRWVSEGHAVGTEVSELEEARRRGAMALFGEKYGKTVRVVEIPGVSLELCGGTHVSNTRDIGLIRIVDESSIASGIRRIEAVSGRAAYGYTMERDRLLSRIAAELNLAPEAIPERIEKLSADLKTAQKELSDLKKQLVASQAGDLKDQVRNAGDIPVLATQIEADSVNALRGAMDQVRSQLPPAVICLAATAQGKTHLICSVADQFTSRVRAGDLVKTVTGIAGGRGGGKADRAQGGVENPDKLEEAFQKLFEKVEGS